MIALCLCLLTQSGLALVPQPSSVSLRKEPAFELRASTRLVHPPNDPQALSAAASFLAAVLPATGYLLSTEVGSSSAPGTILFTREGADPALGAEGYVLEVGADAVVARANAAAGWFYATQTLQQLFPTALLARTPQKDVRWMAPAVTIRDVPRFAWRGWMLDVSRHFFTKDEVKRCIDQLAAHKINTFHWHLVDDHGWRIEIQRYPKLTEIGAWRSAIGFGLDPKSSTAYNAAGRYGGYYTQAEIREVVAYAAARHITVVPEIEMPGHSVAALAAYPQFSCQGQPFDLDVPAGVHAGIYCPGNEQTFEFLENVLREVLELFPSRFIHLGGDEVPREEWKKCARCSARMEQEKLANVEELQSYFLRRMERFVNAQGRRVIGWDEILEGGLAPNAAVMSWRGTSGGLAAANAGHDVVMSPNAELYLDHYQARVGEPKAIGGYTPIEEVYLYEPIPTGLAPDKAKHVLGAQGNLWSEYIPNARQVEYMSWPRMCALAERTWSPRETRDLDDFLNRLSTHLERLEYMGVQFRPQAPPSVQHLLQWVIVDGKPRLDFRAPYAGAQLHYTLDGSEPTAQSTRADGPTALPTTPTPVRVRVTRPGSQQVHWLERWVVGGDTLVSATNLAPLQAALDGNLETAASSQASLIAGETLTLEFATARRLSLLELHSGSSEQPADVPMAAIIEGSVDGQSFEALAEVSGPTIRLELPEQAYRVLRVRILRAQERWWRVREISWR